jgi:hypothetical protein
VGRVAQVEVSDKDARVRAVSIEYKNSNESVFRTTRRAVRGVAVLHREDELELVQELNAAARAAEKLAASSLSYMEHQEAVCREVERCSGCFAPNMCPRHFGYFCRKPYRQDFKMGVCEGVEESITCQEVLCQSLSIHVDPWTQQ